MRPTMNERNDTDLHRMALAIFRATSVEDADALRVLEAQAAELPTGGREKVEKMTTNIFAAAKLAFVGPEEFFDRYAASLDDLEAAQ